MKNKLKIDLFQDYKKQPENLKKICDKYAEKYANGEMDYKDTEEFLKEVNKIGYTFDYGLDNEPFALRLIGVDLTEIEGFEDI